MVIILINKQTNVLRINKCENVTKGGRGGNTHLNREFSVEETRMVEECFIKYLTPLANREM